MFSGVVFLDLLTKPHFLLKKLLFSYDRKIVSICIRGKAGKNLPSLISMLSNLVLEVLGL